MIWLDPITRHTSREVESAFTKKTSTPELIHLTQQIFLFYYQHRIYIAGYNFEKAFINYGTGWF